MKKIFFFLLFPFLLFADETYLDTFDYSKELKVLHSFDVDSAFIYDPILNEMKENLQKKYETYLFFQAMQDASLFIPTIKRILKNNHVPSEFIYMAMAESNFKNEASSSKKAAGLWQFMPKTAEIFGLKIDKYVDERRDPIKSTKAAAQYLSYLHDEFGKWYLAAIAYNCGDGRLRRAIKKAQSDDLSVLLDPDKKYIPKESRFYIRKILALALLGNDETFLSQGERGYLLNRAEGFSIATVLVPSGESLEHIAQVIGVDLEELKQLNQHLKYPYTPPYGSSYEIYIPQSKLIVFHKQYKPSKKKSYFVTYIVKNGDTLWNISRKYGVSTEVIKDFNHLKSSMLHLKQTLIIPVQKQRLAQQMFLAKTKKFYKVQKGDTLESIAKKYKISVANLRAQNNIQGSLIRVGERLRVYE